MNHDPGHDLCRRDFLRVGLGGGLALALSGGSVFAQDDTAQRVAGAGAAEHCILLYMAGGMSQTDTFDPKPGTKNAGPLIFCGLSPSVREVAELLGFHRVVDIEEESAHV